jgi:hypothetical protein
VVIDIALGKEDAAKLERIARQRGVTPEELAAELARNELVRRTAPKPTSGVVTPMRARADKSLERA